MFILSIDIGSSSIRSALFDLDGKIVSRTFVRTEVSFTSTPAGASEMDPVKTLRQVIATVDAVLERAAQNAEISHVAWCTFWHSLVGVDSAGKPTTKVLGWAENRPAKYVAVLRKGFDEKRTHLRNGCRFHSSYWPAKLLWLRKECPEVWSRTHSWFSFSDFIGKNLFGDPRTSVSMASATGLFDIRQCRWDLSLCKYLKVGTKRLPEIVGNSETFQLNAKYGRRWPQLKTAHWLPAIGDGAANNIGLGCINKRRAVLMVGTSGAMRVAFAGAPPARIPDGLWCYRIDRNRTIIGGALSDGGDLYRWLTENLKTPKNVEDEMRRRGAAAHGLTFLPFFHGERSTGYDEFATGAILGLTASHDSTDILQAAMEAVAYRFADILDQLTNILPVKEIIASGGALEASPVWMQIIADVLGRDILVSNVPESSLRGAVLLALESIGKIEILERPRPDLKGLAFHQKCHEVYRKARKRHLAAYKSVTFTR